MKTERAHPDDLRTIWLKLDQLAACSALSPLQRQIVGQYAQEWMLDDDQRRYIEHLHRLVVYPQAAK